MRADFQKEENARFSKSKEFPEEYGKVNGTILPRKKEDTEMLKEDGPIIQVVWRNVIQFACLHVAALYGVYLMFTSALWQTNLFAVSLDFFSMIGVAAGAHRLWSHRSYKARFPLRVFLAFLYTIAYQNDIYQWVRDHRVHHKYSDTDADPHNSKRGFFFSHIGWLMSRKHPEVINKGKQIDLSDLLSDPVVMIQRKFRIPLAGLFCFVLPTLVPMYFWGEDLTNSLYVATLLRYCLTLNQTWLVNSAAHKWGSRPYDSNINPRENILAAFLTTGEGFHNYHHAFPTDYTTSEYGIKCNVSTLFIDLMAWLGLVYDRKKVSKSLVEARKLNTGEKSNTVTLSPRKIKQDFIKEN